MPQIDVDGLTFNYEVQGEGEPLLLVHYTSADHASSWAFQLPAYTTCGEFGGRAPSRTPSAWRRRRPCQEAGANSKVSPPATTMTFRNDPR
jgi:hypothetical protein